MARGYYRFNTHTVRGGQCIWRLYDQQGRLLTRSPKGRTFSTFDAAARHAQRVLKALQAIAVIGDAAR